MSIEKIYKKRRQVRAGWDTTKVPSKDLIHNILKKSLELSPSKQNLYPFKIHVFGPDNEKERHAVSRICCLFKEGSVNMWEDSDAVARSKGQSNKDAPWILVFQLRKAEWNNFIKDYDVMFENGHTRFTQISEDKFRRLSNTKLACIEVGMFTKILSGLCLENDLAISYIRSFPEWRWKEQEEIYRKDTNDAGLTWDALPEITETPLLVVQIGYSTGNDPLATNAIDPNRKLLEDKPPFEDVVQFKSN